MGEEGNTFSPQLPEAFQYSAALYEPHREFRAGLEKIASHIVGGGSPMTFALYGDWGVGKSTALAYLKGLIRGRDDKITFSWCQAPLWARYEDERSALGLEILRGVERGVPATVADMLAGLLKQDLNLVGGHSQPEDYDLAASLALLNVLRSIPNAPPVIEKWILRYITRTGPIRHVVMLDDLDRCEPEFVVRLLKATNHWTMEIDPANDRSEHHSASIYFVLACREDFLINSQTSGEIKDPRQSLEKYVHVTLGIPRLLNGPADTANYLQMLVGRLNGLPVSARDRLASMIVSSAENYPDGLFTPLLRVAGYDSSTPRAIKTRLNLALTEIDYEQLGDETLVKEWIIKAFWPDFWANQYRALLAQQDAAPESALSSRLLTSRTRGKNLLSDVLSERFEPIRTVGERLKGLLDMSDEALSQALDHVGGEVRADLTDVKPQLAIYLACEPAWPTPPPRVGAVLPRDEVFRVATSDKSRRSDGEHGHGDESIAQSTTQSALAQDAYDPDKSPSTDDLRASAETEFPTDPEDQILFFYLAADDAEDQDDAEAVEENLNRLLAVARWVGPSTGRGSTIGNAALIAERAGLRPVAFELHKLARAASPNHFNIMQNYIEFILDERITSAYAEAQHLYEILMTDGKNHKPFRTRILGLRLAGVTHETILDLAERNEEVLSMLAAEPTPSRLMDITKISPDIIGYDTMRQACRIVAERAADIGTLSVTLHIMLAAVGMSNNHAHEREVVDATRWMLKVGIACSGGDNLYAVTLLNLGQQLGALDYRAAATLVFGEAYRLNPRDADVRRALASSLERMNLNSDATAVLLGRLFKLDAIEPEPLPVFLSESDHTDRWWERLTVPSPEPCPTNLPWLIPQQLPQQPEIAG